MVGNHVGRGFSCTKKAVSCKKYTNPLLECCMLSYMSLADGDSLLTSMVSPDIHTNDIILETDILTIKLKIGVCLK